MNFSDDEKMKIPQKKSGGEDHDPERRARGPRAGLSCRRRAGAVQGGICSAGRNLLGGDRCRGRGLVMVGGIEEGGLQSAGGSPDDAAAAGGERRQHSLGKRD
ncbi:unnamed protein product [Pleuronectes platessa]|uniref:Uncharacterized protein n=1 Tax=Pleuronectes platessa TaxID=8262 RepID=A0A9N7UY78_PLEPL|nr:unnamed protein product [Pleuronectes platessa]